MERDYSALLLSNREEQSNSSNSRIVGIPGATPRCFRALAPTTSILIALGPSIEVAPGFPPLGYDFVVVNQGEKFILVVDSGAINGVAYKVD